MFQEILQNSKENTCNRVSFLIKLQGSACNFIKKDTLTQVFSCEFCEIFKNTFSYRTFPVAVSWHKPVESTKLHKPHSINPLTSTLCYYHVTYFCQSESTHYSCLNVKELLARNRWDIWSLNDSNEIRTHNRLVRKRTLNHLAKLAKWLSCVVSTYLYGASEYILLSCHVHIFFISNSISLIRIWFLKLENHLKSKVA